MSFNRSIVLLSLAFLSSSRELSAVITVKMLSGKTLAIDGAKTILELKRAILKNAGVNMHEQRIIINGKEMNDDAELINDGSQVHLGLRLKRVRDQNASKLDPITPTNEGGFIKWIESQIGCRLLPIAGLLSAIGCFVGLLYYFLWEPKEVRDIEDPAQEI